MVFELVNKEAFISLVFREEDKEYIDNLLSSIKFLFIIDKKDNFIKSNKILMEYLKDYYNEKEQVIIVKLLIYLLVCVNKYTRLIKYQKYYNRILRFYNNIIVDTNYNKEIFNATLNNVVIEA